MYGRMHLGNGLRINTGCEGGLVYVGFVAGRLAKPAIRWQDVEYYQSQCYDTSRFEDVDPKFGIQIAQSGIVTGVYTVSSFCRSALRLGTAIPCGRSMPFLSWILSRSGKKDYSEKAVRNNNVLDNVKQGERSEESVLPTGGQAPFDLECRRCRISMGREYGLRRIEAHEM